MLYALQKIIYSSIVLFANTNFFLYLRCKCKIRSWYVSLWLKQISVNAAYENLFSLLIKLIFFLADIYSSLNNKLTSFSSISQKTRLMSFSCSFNVSVDICTGKQDRVKKKSLKDSIIIIIIIIILKYCVFLNIINLRCSVWCLNTNKT